MLSDPLKLFERFLLVSTVAALLTIASTARADGRDEARKLATKGVELLNDGKPVEALERLRAAEVLFHAPTHLLYIARAERAAGHPEEAYDTYVSILVEVLPNYAPDAFRDAQRDAAKEEADLRKEIAAITIELPAGNELRLIVDGKGVVSTRLAYPLAVSEGDHDIDVHGDANHEPFTTRVNATRGRTTEVKVPPLASKAPKQAHAPVAESPGPRPMLVAGGVTLALGGATLIAGTATGIVTLIRASDIRDRCPANVCPKALEPEAADARTIGHASTALLAVGGALAATGVVLLVVDGTKHREQPSSTALVRFGPASVAFGTTF
jgi:hypothetical protein